MKKLRILRVETGHVELSGDASVGVLDYRVYANVPNVWRRIEKLLRLDWYLALKAKAMEGQYDVIWANSEKVGIPLSFLQLKKPMIVIAHNPGSPIKAKLMRWTGIVKKWAAVGYTNPAGKEFLSTYFEIPPDRLFQYLSARYIDFSPTSQTLGSGPILSLGAAKRDYRTLISALKDLPGYETNIFVSSRYGDELRSRFDSDVPKWIHFPGFVPEDELIRQYQETRFVVVPLEKTTHFGAGVSVILEAGALGKAVIATRTEGTECLVQDGETGILVPPYDVLAMKAAIHRLWENPELAHRMGMAGRRFVESEYNPKDVAAATNAMLWKIAQQTQ